MEIRVGRVFRLLEKCGSGSFGEVWKGLDIITNRKVAVKLEPLKANHHHVLSEAKLYNLLQKAVGIPTIHWYGCEGDYAVLVMDFLGPSLEDLFMLQKKSFGLSTVSLLGVQLIDRLETIHNAGIIHRDIKPQNFLMGSGRSPRILYAIDFGLAKMYKHSETGVHISYREGKALTGTARYASISTHLGVEQSRRDDIEAVGYVLLSFIRGALPWQGLRAQSKRDKYTRICIKKMSTPLSILCRDLPHEFIMFFQYTRSLRFVQRPDYEFLRGCLGSLFYHDEGFLQILKNGQEIAQSVLQSELQRKELELNIFEWERDTPFPRKTGRRRSRRSGRSMSFAKNCDKLLLDEQFETLAGSKEVLTSQVSVNTGNSSLAVDTTVETSLSDDSQQENNLCNALKSRSSSSYESSPVRIDEDHLLISGIPTAMSKHSSTSCFSDSSSLSSCIDGYTVESDKDGFEDLNEDQLNRANLEISDILSEDQKDPDLEVFIPPSSFGIGELVSEAKANSAFSSCGYSSQYVDALVSFDEIKACENDRPWKRSKSSPSGVGINKVAPLPLKCVTSSLATEGSNGGLSDVSSSEETPVSYLPLGVSCHKGGESVEGSSKPVSPRQGLSSRAINQDCDMFDKFSYSDVFPISGGEGEQPQNIHMERKKVDMNHLGSTDISSKVSYYGLNMDVTPSRNHLLECVLHSNGPLINNDGISDGVQAMISDNFAKVNGDHMIQNTDIISSDIHRTPELNHTQNMELYRSASEADVVPMTDEADEADEADEDNEANEANEANEDNEDNEANEANEAGKAG